MRARLLQVILAATIFASGCATIISGKHQKIPVRSDPPGATVKCNDGATATTPGTIIVHRKEAHTLTAEHPGYEPQEQKITKTLNNWIWAGILLDFGIISIPTDFVTGAANELHPKEVHFQFAQKNSNP